MTPLIMIGVPSSLYSGRGPSASVLKRHATSSLVKLDALIWSSGEYLLPRRSAVYIGHSPFLVLATDPAWPAWPDTRGAIQTSPAARSASAGTIRRVFRDIVYSRVDTVPTHTDVTFSGETLHQFGPAAGEIGRVPGARENGSKLEKGGSCGL